MKYIIRTVVVIVATLPLFVYSAGLPPLVVCDPSPTGAGSGLSKVCDFSALITVANNIVRFCIVLGSSVFAIVFMYAGFLYLTARGDSAQISKGHSLFWNAIIGFVIMLMAWLFVDFIFTALVKNNEFRLLSK
jgi:hypothetical protein